MCYFGTNNPFLIYASYVILPTDQWGTPNYSQPATEDPDMSKSDHIPKLISTIMGHLCMFCPEYYTEYMSKKFLSEQNYFVFTKQTIIFRLLWPTNSVILRASHIFYGLYCCCYRVFRFHCKPRPILPLGIVFAHVCILVCVIRVFKPGYFKRCETTHVHARTNKLGENMQSKLFKICIIVDVDE